MIPAELRDRDQWLLWSSESDPPKKPLNRDGYNASWTDPGEWLSYDEATQLASESDTFDGVGFVIAEADPYIGLDLDTCLREPMEEKPKNWLPDIGRFTGSYMAYSNSGTGLHVIVEHDSLPDWWNNSHFSDEEHEGVEAYEQKFFILTGDRVESASETIEPIDPAPFLADAYEAINGEPPRLPGSESKPNTDLGLAIHDVVSASSYPEGENNAHPFHPSDTGTNFHVDADGETFRCWRHDVTGGAAHLLGIEQGVIQCGEWANGGLDSDTWREIFDAAREAGYDIPDPKAKAADGGAVASRTSDAGPTELPGSLTPDSVILETGNDPDESDLTSLRNDAIAFAVGELITQSDEYHFRVTSDNGEIYAYHGDVWENDGERKLREVLYQAVRDCNSQHLHGEVKHALRSNPRLKIDRESLGAPDGCIAVENGLLDLSDREIRPLKPTDFAVRKVPVEFDRSASYGNTEWMDFLKDSVRPGDLKKLQEYAGYCLWHHAQPFGKALFLIGPTDSGKGTFLEVLESVIGADNVASQSLYELMQTRWGLAELYGKFANIRNEVTGGGLGNVQRFKELTGGGDRVSAERKGQNPFKFQAVQKFVFATNQVPEVQHAGEPFFNRLLFAKFPETVPPEKQDADLADNLLEDKPAILNWMLDGLDRLMDQGQFSGEQSIDDKREVADAFGSVVDRFKHNMLKVTGDPEDLVHKSQLHELFTDFADWAGKDAVAQQTFTKELKEENGVGDGRSKRVDGDSDRPHVFKGVRVVEENVSEVGGGMPSHALSDGDETTESGSQQHFG